MRKLGLASLFVVLVATSANAGDFTIGHREARIGVGVARTYPGGGHSDVMRSGMGVSADFGIAFSRGIVVGVQFKYASLKTASGAENMARSPVIMMKNNWHRYAGGLFIDYSIITSALAPFVGGHLEVHGIRITDRYSSGDVLWHGDFGLGFALSAGLRYRSHARYGVFLRLQAEHSNALSEGWFYSVAAGGSLYF